MSHVLTYPAHADKHAAVVGSDFLHDLALSHLCPQHSTCTVRDDAPLSSVSQGRLLPVSVLHLQGAARHLTAHDIPTLGRLVKVYDKVVVSGSHWSDVEVEEWWKRSGTRKIFDSTKMSTKTSRRLLEQWVSNVSSLSSSMSVHACEQVGYDPAKAVALARKVAVFDGLLTGSDISLLAQDFHSDDFVAYLLQMRTREALAAAETLDEAQVRAALVEAAHALPLLARVNAAVIAYPAPSGEASRSSRLPTTTLAKYWKIAGRYTPQDVLYRLDLLRYLTESSPRNYSSLVSLVAMW